MPSPSLGTPVVIYTEIGQFPERHVWAVGRIEGNDPTDPTIVTARAHMTERTWVAPAMTMVGTPPFTTPPMRHVSAGGVWDYVQPTV